jgi:hypothetical protein
MLTWPCKAPLALAPDVPVAAAVQPTCAASHEQQTGRHHEAGGAEVVDSIRGHCGRPLSLSRSAHLPKPMPDPKLGHSSARRAGRPAVREDRLESDGEAIPARTWGCSRRSSGRDAAPPRRRARRGRSPALRRSPSSGPPASRMLCPRSDWGCAGSERHRSPRRRRADAWRTTSKRRHGGRER